jgi:pentapeptide MXKDX repeat protein
VIGCPRVTNPFGLRSEDWAAIAVFRTRQAQKEFAMTTGKIAAILTAATLSLGLAVAASAQDKMSKDGMTKTDTMSKDGMSKDGMAKGSMAKDGMAKDGMAKDNMAKDNNMMKK